MADWVAGVDGCRVGWVVVLRSVALGCCTARVVPNFAAVLSLTEAPSTIAVDMPIGLLDESCVGGRACEIDARRRLPGRRSSVFSAPTRPALAAFRAGGNYRAVSAANRDAGVSKRGLSQQAFAILPKIDEVDAALTPSMQTLVREVHPELSFAAANCDTPMRFRKKNSVGQDEREAVLRTLGFAAPQKLLGPRLPVGVKADDLLDACIACWTAGRIAAGVAVVTPAAPPIDPRGLRMELWR
jgi:predicted RNase H-like nuclease